MSTVKLTVVAAKVAGSETNMPLLIIPSLITGLGTISSADANSARLYSDVTKLVEQAREIVSSNEIHTKIAALTNVSEVYFDYDGIRADYATTDTYGRNNVWTGHSGVWHGDSTTDSKAATNDLTLTGSGTYTSGKLGQAFTTSARNQYWRTGSSPSGLPSGANSFSLSYWLYWNGTPTSYNMPVSWGVDTNNTGYFAPNSGPNWPRMASFWGGGAGFGYVEPVTPTFSTGTWIKIDTTYDTAANVHTVYANGVSIGSVGYNGSNITNSYFNIAKHMNTTTYGIIGSIDEVRVINNGVYSANWITTEYNNQSSVDTFLYIGPQETASAGGVTPVSNIIWFD